ncbi:MAG TPA: polyisoprenoid-binding protein, partial [Dyella sp.]|nr:polyisoprenoid-binding protein [Dyella sp.]
MTSLKFAATLLLALAIPGVAGATDYAMQPAGSKLGFASTFQGQSFNGSFGKWTAAISYDASKLAT